MPNSPHLDGHTGGGHAPRALQPSDWWEFEVSILLSEVQLTQIDLSAPGTIPIPAGPGPNEPHLA